MRNLVIVALLALNSCTPVVPCKPLPALPDPATVQDKDNWIVVVSNNYGVCARAAQGGVP